MNISESNTSLQAAVHEEKSLAQKHDQINAALMCTISKDVLQKKNIVIENLYKTGITLTDLQDAHSQLYRKHKFGIARSHATSSCKKKSHTQKRKQYADATDTDFILDNTFDRFRILC